MEIPIHSYGTVCKACLSEQKWVELSEVSINSQEKCLQVNPTCKYLPKTFISRICKRDTKQHFPSSHENNIL